MADKGDMTALCMKCRNDENKPTMQKMKEDGMSVHEKKNRYSAKGQCDNCSGNMFKFLSKDDAMALKDQGVNFQNDDE